MRYFVKSFEKENVTLTGYIHDVSNELKNAQIRPAVLIFRAGGTLCVLTGKRSR